MVGRWRIMSFAAIAVVVFCAGATAGHFATMWHFRPVMRDGKVQVREVFMRRVSYALGLDSAQAEALQPIVQDFQEKAFAVREKVKPELEILINEAIEEAKPHLDKKQLARLELFRSHFSSTTPQTSN